MGKPETDPTVVVVVVEVVVVVARDGSVEVVVMAMLVPLVVLEGRSDLHNRGANIVID